VALQSSALAPQVRAYARRGRNQIAGWFQRVDAEIFSEILLDQAQRGVAGAALEIGVHHGRSFIPLSLTASPEAPAIAVDLFDRQDLNQVDPSGKGDYQRFLKNLSKFGDPRCVRVIAGSSLDLSPQDIGERVRFASVDGAHWHAAVVSDLKLVEKCSASDCVVAIDDVFNPDFAEVMAAYFEWKSGGPKFEALAISQGKLYLCRPEHREYYQNLLESNPFLLFNRKKALNLGGSRIPCFTGLHRGATSTLKRYLQLRAPNTYASLKAWVRSRGRRAEQTVPESLRARPVEDSR
jgi:hypothetical protein